MGRINLVGRLGFSLDISPDELRVLTADNIKAAQDLLIKLVKSEKCKIVGDTYFPQGWNEALAEFEKENILEFDLPETPLFEGDEPFELVGSKDSDEVYALKCEISNLRHELEGALMYDPDKAPEIDMILARKMCELECLVSGKSIDTIIARQGVSAATNQKLDDMAGFLEDFFWSQLITLNIDVVDGHLIARDDEGNSWKDAEIYDFALNECLCFNADGTLSAGLAAAEPFAERLKEDAKAFGVEITSFVKPIEDRLTDAVKRSAENLKDANFEPDFGFDK